MDPIVIKRNGHSARFHGSWYRGEHTNFIPSKAELAKPYALDEFILKGWLPPAPFIRKDTAVTAFGSCFASHVTNYLHARGYHLLGKDLNLNSHLIRFGEGIVNSFAVLQQFEWALAGKRLPSNLWFGKDKEIAEISPEVQEATRQIITQTEVFIITLGLSEIWYDKASGEAFWRAIPAEMFDPECHGFRVSSCEENRRNLERMLELIRSASPSAKVVLTLSPVPLMATFRSVSCITASTVSKSILRVAIDELMRAHGDDPNLFYFPSYEIVKEMFVNPFKRDNRHPKPEVIEFVMKGFERHYCVAEA